MNITPPWWQHGVIYQIYPKSFQDTTGSGTGYLIGVIKRLDYLQRLGVDAIWLTPFYISPQVDNGYDVANYCAIDPTYGTLDDFDLLVAEAHQRGIRVILDMVFNHTSTQHAWFHEAQDKTSPYREFYIWRDGTPDLLPNNWRSKFGGNAWRWHAESGQYYLHSKYLQQQNRSDIQLASVGNTPLMKFLHPEIITVDPGYAEAGRAAALQLIGQISRHQQLRQIVIPSQLQ